VHAGIGAHAIAVRLSAVARREGRAWPARRVAAAGLLAWLPFTIGWWWDPPRTDPHFTAALEPVPPEMQALAAWVRARTSGQDLLAAAPRSAAWLPALAGRRVVRVPTDDLAGFDPATVPAPGVRVLVADAPGAAEPPGVVEEFRAGSLTAYRLGR
jgi:hypothetical protein